jgi:lysophospholipase L1-like esterase
LLLLCAVSSLRLDATAAPLRVLFIGNSLTTWNDLPGMFAALAQAGGHERPATRTIAIGGFSLEDHWIQGDAQRVIANEPWDVVVLQQGPSALADSRRLLVEYARRFGDVIRRAGATPALYAVWPSLSRRADFPGVSASYAAAARAVDGTLLPVGDAWRAVMQAHRDIALYSEDGLHPTREGTYLAALVIYRQLYGAPVEGLPALGVSDADARRLQGAVR